MRSAGPGKSQTVSRRAPREHSVQKITAQKKVPLKSRLRELRARPASIFVRESAAKMHAGRGWGVGERRVCGADAFKVV